MKTKIRLIVLLLFATGITAFGQKDKSRSFVIERVIKAPAEEVWKVVGENFTDIAKSHPKLISSHYVEGTPKTGEGCERVCNLSEDGKKYTQEKIVNYNPKDYSFKAEIAHIGKLPLVASNSYMLYDVDPIDENTCVIKLKMVFQTKPAFLGALAKGKFRKTINDYSIAIEHHVLTGEDVNPDNFKEIKKKYQS